MKFSARRFLVILVTSTYCLCIIGALALCIMKMIAVDVFLALFAGVGTLVMYITKAYFDDVVHSDDVKKEAV